jgi:hypothetical protein
VGDRVGGAVIGNRLEDQLALDLEQVADLVEDAREVPVRGQRHRNALVDSHSEDGTRRGTNGVGVSPCLPDGCYAVSTRLRP